MLAVNLNLGRAVGSAAFWMVMTDGATARVAPIVAAAKVGKRRRVSRLTIYYALARAARELRNETPCLGRLC